MKVLLVDTHNMLHRARFGFGDGDHKIYFNFFRMLMGELKRHTPDIVYVVDEGRPTKSLELLETYKGNREKLKDPQFHREKKEVFETIKTISGFTYIRHPDFECDDVIGQLASCVHKADDVTIISTDSDFIQLISENVNVWHPQKKKFLENWHVDYVTWKALRGDPTDNVSGVSGIGPKRADVLAADAKTLENFLEKDPIKREQFEISRGVIQLKEVPKDKMEVVQSDFIADKLFNEFSNRQFKTMIGNAWPKWVEQFSKSGGKHAI